MSVQFHNSSNYSKHKHTQTCNVSIQGICWKRGMLPKCLLSIKGRTCNQTLLVHQDMTKKTTFYKKN